CSKADLGSCPAGSSKPLLPTPSKGSHFRPSSWRDFGICRSNGCRSYRNDAGAFCSGSKVRRQDFARREGHIFTPPFSEGRSAARSRVFDRGSKVPGTSSSQGASNECYFGAVER